MDNPLVAQHGLDETEIRRRIDKLAEAIRNMDLKSAMHIYAPDIVSFDLSAPLACVGAEAKRQTWAEAFAKYERPLDYEIHDLTVSVDADLAFAHSLNRLRGTLKGGKETAFWLRWTTCFRKVDGNWFIAHEQISVPVDPESGRALLELEP